MTSLKKAIKSFYKMVSDRKIDISILGIKDDDDLLLVAMNNLHNHLEEVLDDAAAEEYEMMKDGTIPFPAEPE